MKREVQGIVLLALGATVMRITLGGQYLRYVKEWLQVGLIVAAAVLMGLGALCLVDCWRDARRGGADGSDCGHGDLEPGDVDLRDSGHDHSHHTTRVAWLLLLPVFAVYVIAPPALGSFSAARATSNSTAPKDGAYMDPLPPGDPAELTMSEYVTRSVWDFGKTLSGRTVKLTGFVTPDPAGGWWLTRIGLTCCAADSVTYRVKMVGAAALPSDTWVDVTGEWTPGGGTQDPKAVPLLRASRVTQIQEPRNPYQ